MIRRFKTAVNAHYDEVYATIKLEDVEERFDIWFSRFFGLFFAKMGYRFNWTPTQVSLASLVFGVIGGILIYFQYDWTIMLWASLLITLAGVLDSADGQLARMSNQSTELGRIIDGAIDNCVFIAAYLAGCTYFYHGEIGWPIFVMGIIGGFVSHNYSSAVYEMYKTDYLYYVGQAKDAKIPRPEEIKEKLGEYTGMSKLLFWIYYDYTKKQYWLSTRTREVRDTYERYAYNEETKGRFIELYRQMIKPTLNWWAWVGGTNVHRTLLMGFSLFGRFDLYLVVLILKIIPFLIISYLQKERDNELLSMLNAEFSDAPVNLPEVKMESKQVQLSV